MNTLTGAIDGIASGGIQTTSYLASGSIGSIILTMIGVALVGWISYKVMGFVNRG